MANPVLHGLRNLARFEGRDRQGMFWPYAGLVLALAVVLGGVAIAGAVSGFIADMNAFAAAHPEATTVTSGPGSYSMTVDGSHPDAPAMDVTLFFTCWRVIVLATVVLLAAAVTRRLHDTGRSALLALAPLPFLATGLIFLPGLVERMTEAPEANIIPFVLVSLNNLVSLVALVTLLFLLIGSSTEGPNRHGPAPRA